MEEAAKRTNHNHNGLREAMLLAAEAAISRGGEWTIREVARAVGASSGAPYRRFPTREAIVEAIAIRGFARLRTELDLAGDFYGLAAIYLAWARLNAGIYRIMFSLDFRDRGRPVLREAARGVAGVFAKHTPATGGHRWT